MLPTIRTTILALVSAAAFGCQSQTIWFEDDPLTPRSKAAAGEPLGVVGEASAVPGTIGHATVTVFAIPSGDLSLQNGPEAIMQRLGAALEAAGYRPVAPDEAPESPRLACEVTRFEFRNYTWFIPLVLTWGDIELTLRLEDPAGETLWEKAYVGAYDDGDFGVSFHDAVNEAFRQILEEAADDFTGDAFRAACCPAPPPGP